VRGLRSKTASAIAAVVATLRARTPIIGGIPPVGTFFFSIDLMSCLSPPCGYFVLTGTTLMLLLLFEFSRAEVKVSIAFGLLSSIPMKTFEHPEAFLASFIPAIILFVHSSMIR